MPRDAVAIDFDGTIVSKKPYPGIGRMKWGAAAFARELRQRGYKVVVFTARGDHAAVARFLRGENYPFDDVTSKKPRNAIVFVDDRAIRFTGGWLSVGGEVLNELNKIEMEKQRGI